MRHQIDWPLLPEIAPRMSFLSRNKGLFGLAEMGAKLLDESGLTLISANGLADAAEKIVAAVKA